MSSIEENKRIARRWLELITEHKIEEICSMTAPNWRIHGAAPGLPPGADGVRKLFEAIGPIDQEWTIEDVIAEGDKVVVRATNTCVQESFLGIPGGGQRQTFSAMFIHWIVDGKIIETWRNADDLGRLIQLGARIEPGRSE
ncbi:ester cyclase [Aetokthonos hydrillicola Thurmond2011]|jgi:predicted ester cyclase|uniref:Ester cyclase n=1 Tax=Aetokthonos hydrillicola Thurmond2011 TaxID=2712845 RepID=A0AAP5M9P7_9CYAN|nr:ester cyclase [Aetokthonos hydrillicola]MBO3461059.1 ester cyclase [Aetokthonos hydrillicola CCALA 1050]MBW4586312.1 ester cyclase [Aetokthonos hydrillicola CCALA 1050]MDR9897440.1 ester cyclase [Aetokthonos hydrillicola Thurmond2011]